MNEYICGVVIGPIYETIMQSKSLSQHWFASYLFSEISRNTIIGIHDSFSGEHQLEMLVPIITKSSLNNVSSFGKFPDQIIFKVIGDEEEINSKLEAIVNYVKYDQYEEYTLDKLETNYFDIDYVIQSGDNLEKLLSQLNAIDNSLSNYSVDSKLFINNFGKYATDGFEVFLDRYKRIGSKLKKIEDMIKESGFSENYAVIYYDGNSVGKKLMELYNSDIEKYKKASAGLFKFSDEVSEYLMMMLSKAHCLPLYIAGDDGFMIMPINYKGIKFTDVLSHINELYNTHVTSRDQELTLRFSVVIAEKNIPFKILYQKVYDGLYEAKNLKGSSNNILINFVRGGAQDTKFIYNFLDFVNDNGSDSQQLLAKALNSKVENYVPANVLAKLEMHDYVLEEAWDQEYLENCLNNVFELGEYKNIINKLIIEINEQFKDENTSTKVDNFKNLLTDYIKILNYLNDRVNEVHNEQI